MGLDQALELLLPLDLGLEGGGEGLLFPLMSLSQLTLELLGSLLGSGEVAGGTVREVRSDRGSSHSDRDGPFHLLLGCRCRGG